MKVIVFSVTASVLSLALGSPFALGQNISQDKVAEAVSLSSYSIRPVSSTSSTTSVSSVFSTSSESSLPDAPETGVSKNPKNSTNSAEPSSRPELPDSVISPNLDGSSLPDSPQAAPAIHGNPMYSPTIGPRPLSPQSFHDKFMACAFATVGPRALFVPAFPAALRMATPPSHYPAGWRQGAEAFGRNYGDQLATASAFATARFAVGAALHEDLRYHPSTSTNFFSRASHALSFTFIDNSDDGHARPAFANFAGLAAGSYVGTSYLPAGFNDITHADQRLAARFGALAGSNLGAEFAPDIFHFFSQHLLPIPRIPIPEWWVKQ